MSWRFGDAHYSNILLQGGRVSGIVDWEGAKPEQWVLNDWLQFVFQYMVELAGVRKRSAQRNSLAREVLTAMSGIPLTRLDEMALCETEKFIGAWRLDRQLLPTYVAHFARELYWPDGKNNLLSEIDSAGPSDVS